MPPSAPHKRYIAGTVLAIVVSSLLVLSVVFPLFLILHPNIWMPAERTDDNIFTGMLMYVFLGAFIVETAKPAIGVMSGLVLLTLVYAVLHRRVLPTNVFKLRLGFTIGALVLVAATISFFGLG